MAALSVLCSLIAGLLTCAVLLVVAVSLPNIRKRCEEAFQEN